MVVVDRERVVVVVVTTTTGDLIRGRQGKAALGLMGTSVVWG